VRAAEARRRLPGGRRTGVSLIAGAGRIDLGGRTVETWGYGGQVPARGVFAPLGFALSPAIGALSMSGSSVIVAVNALLLRRLCLPQSPGRADQDAHQANPAGDQRGTLAGDAS